MRVISSAILPPRHPARLSFDPALSQRFSYVCLEQIGILFKLRGKWCLMSSTENNKCAETESDAGWNMVEARRLSRLVTAFITSLPSLLVSNFYLNLADPATFLASIR